MPRTSRSTLLQAAVGIGNKPGRAKLRVRVCSLGQGGLGWAEGWHTEHSILFERNCAPLLYEVLRLDTRIRIDSEPKMRVAVVTAVDTATRSWAWVRATVTV